MNSISESIFQSAEAEELVINETEDDVLLVLSLPGNNGEKSNIVRMACEKSEKVCGCDAKYRPVSQCNCQKPADCFINKEIKDDNVFFAKYDSQGNRMFPLKNTLPEIGFMKHILGANGGVAIGLYCQNWGLKSISFPHASLNCDYRESKKVCRDIVFENVKFSFGTKKEIFLK